MHCQLFENLFLYISHKNPCFGENIDCEYERSLANGFASIIAENIDSAKKDDFINDKGFLGQNILGKRNMYF